MSCLRFRQRRLRAQCPKCPLLAVPGCYSLLLLAVIFRRCCRKAGVFAAVAKPLAAFFSVLSAVSASGFKTIDKVSNLPD
jgi:hypothetical protein